MYVEFATIETPSAKKAWFVSLVAGSFRHTEATGFQWQDDQEEKVRKHARALSEFLGLDVKEVTHRYITEDLERDRAAARQWNEAVEEWVMKQPEALRADLRAKAAWR